MKTIVRKRGGKCGEMSVLKLNELKSLPLRQSCYTKMAMQLC